MSSSLCERCSAFQRWSASTARKWYQSAKFQHWATGTLLEAAAAKGCHLCKLILQALMKSERPDGEENLPDRKIYLSFAPADLTGRGLRIDVKIEPESLETAGRPRFDGSLKPGFMIVSEGAKERVRTTSMMTHGLGLDQFWIANCKGGYEYFRGAEKISAAEFWAIINPCYSAKVEIYPLPNDISSVIEKCSTLPDESTGSPAAFHLALSWLKTCITTHVPCRHFAAMVPELPTRVIDVGSSDGSAPSRLHVSTAGQKAVYLTLSHRWGTSKICKTTKNRLHKFEQEIPWDELPQTFQDAISITRNLKFRYLWIDSLCIVQDDESDWTSEAPKMGNIYRQGILNLSAIDSDNPGCFRERDGTQCRPCKLDIKVPDRYLPVRHTGPIHAVPRQTLGAKKLSQAYRGPLDSRAWVLQEYMLACRTLNFGKKMIYWNCLAMLASESVPEGAEMGDLGIKDDGGFVQDFKGGLSGVLQKLHDPLSKGSQTFSRTWFLTVEAYTRRSITMETDRLTAIAGLATEYQKATGDVYLAGLWKRNILDGLLWSVWARGCPTVGNTLAQKGDHGPYGERYTKFKAPSWSWASISGYIRYFEQYEQDERVEQKFMAEAVDANSVPSDPGIVSHSYAGTIIIRGQLREAITCAASPFSIDWDTQNQSNAVLRIRHAMDKIEDLRSNPLSTTIPQGKEKDGPTISTFSPTGNSYEHLDSAISSSSKPVETYGESKIPIDTSELDINNNIELLGVPSSKDKQANVVSADKAKAQFPRDPNYTSMPDDMFAFLAQGIDFDEFQSAIDVRGDSIGINVRAIEKWGDRAVSKLNSGQFGGSINVLDTRHTEAAAWPVHTLLDSRTRRTIGFWAPDISDHMGFTVSRMLISCLAISRRKQHVWCLGLVPNGESSEEYRRAGLAYINARDWEAMVERPLVTVKIV